MNYDGQCASECVPSTKFAFDVGSAYKYGYETDVVTSLAGASEEHSALHVRTTVHLHAVSPCEFAITVS